jgi:uncharacterized protein with HEPN domain
MSRDDATLLDLARAARLAGDFVQGIDQAAFQADLKTQSAVLHQLLILGEAAKRLSPSFRDAHAQVPWALVAGMRDKLIHHYEAVDLAVVWDTLQKDLPRLLAFLTPLLPAEET